jgi:hypothetical protein
MRPEATNFEAAEPCVQVVQSASATRSTDGSRSIRYCSSAADLVLVSPQESLVVGVASPREAHLSGLVYYIIWRGLHTRWQVLDVVMPYLHALAAHGVVTMLYCRCWGTVPLETISGARRQSGLRVAPKPGVQYSTGIRNVPIVWWRALLQFSYRQTMLASIYGAAERLETAKYVGRQDRYSLTIFLPCWTRA